jgi:plasmid stabilization system protein ParE
MTGYTVVITEEARADIQAFYRYILYERKSPLTAFRNRKGLYDTIRKLSVYAGSIAVNRSEYLQFLYGPGARRINYRRMAIIYVVYGNCARIKRVIPGALVPY